MSSSSHSFETGVPFQTVVLTELDIDHIKAWASNVRGKRLTDDEVTGIKKELAANPYHNLAHNIHGLITHSLNNESYSGLMPNDIAELIKLIKQKAQVAQRIKDVADVSPDDMRSIIEYEKKIRPLNVAMTWWAERLEYLKEERNWDYFITITLKNHQNNEMTDEERDKILAQLDIFKLDWMNQYYTAAYLSDRLLEFYNYHLANIEGDIIFCLAMEKKSTAIDGYLNYLLVQIKNLKKQIIYSMIYRLLCAEHYQDVECDDVLSHLLEQLEKQCKITTSGEVTHNPPLRRSLSPDLASQFVDAVTKYCQNNSVPHHMLETLKKLKMRSTPAAWQTAATNQQLEKLNADPIILYAEHMLPMLENTLVGLMYTELPDADHPTSTATDLMTYKKIKKIVFEITTGEAQVPHHVVNKIKKLINVARKKYLSIMGKPIEENSNPAAQSLLNHFKRCEDKLISIKSESELYIKHLFNELLSLHPNDKRVTHRLTSFSIAVHNINLFNKDACSVSYSPNADIVLMVAKHLYGYIESGQIPTQHKLELLRKMISNTYVLSGQQLDSLINIFKNMPDTLKNIASIQKELILPFIAHQIEAPLLSLHSINTAISRHKSISERPNRAWKETSDINISEEGSAFSNLVNYIENVSLRLIPVDNTITLENFDTILCQEASFSINPDYAKQAANMEKAKTIIQNAIADHLLKMMLDIKSYLVTPDNKIDPEKLNDLLEKITNFFQKPAVKEAKDNLIALLKRACCELLKVQLIENISNNRSINLDHLIPINASLNTNLLKLTCDEPSLKETIRKYIKSTDGGNNILSSLLTEASNIPVEFVSEYAEKRLNHIAATYNVSSEDYFFFARYQENAAIKPILERFRTKLERNINDVSLSNSKWDPDQAGIIELFGSRKQVQSYRARFIIECLLNPETLTTAAMDAFVKKINPIHNQQKQIIDLQLIISNGVTFETTIKNIINNKSWSPNIETLLHSLNEPKFMHELHLAFFRQVIAGNDKVINQSHILQIMSKGFANYKASQSTAKSAQDLANKAFYENFFGAHNIQEICQIMEPIFLELSKIAQDLNPTTNFNKSDVISIGRKIDKAKLFAKPYLLYGKNEDLKKFLHVLYDFADRFRFQSDIATLPNADHPALEKPQSLEITQITQQIIKLENQLEGCTPGTAIAEYYINFCEKQILDKIYGIITTQAESLTYDALSHLTNLIFHLSCDEIKFFLVKSYNDLIPDNPYWLSVINKYDDFPELKALAKSIPDNLFSPIKRVYSYSEKLHALHSELHKLLKRSLIREAKSSKKNSKNNKNNKERINIPEEATSMRDLLTEDNIKDKTLLKLWMKYKEQIESLSKSRSTQDGYLVYANKLFEKLSDELLSRSQNRPDLIQQIVDVTRPSTPKKTITPQKSTAISAATTSSSHIRRESSSFWAKPKEKLFTEKLKSIHDASVLTQMMQVVTEYLQKKLHKDTAGINSFLKQFPYSPLDNLSDTDKISSLQQQLKLSEKDAPKILNAIHLHHDLIAIREGRLNILYIKSLILKLYSDMQGETASKSKRYMTFIEDLNKKIHTILPDIAKPVNDLKFGEGTTTLTLK